MRGTLGVLLGIGLVIFGGVTVSGGFDAIERAGGFDEAAAYAFGVGLAMMLLGLVAFRRGIRGRRKGGRRDDALTPDGAVYGAMLAGALSDRDDDSGSGASGSWDDGGDSGGSDD